MELVRWSYENLHVPLLKDSNGKLWCTNKQLTEALNISDASLRVLKHRHSDEFDDDSVTKRNAVIEVRSRKVEFGYRHVRSDLQLWSHHDMILLAVLSKSSVSKEFRKKLVKFIDENAVIQTEKYDSLQIKHKNLQEAHHELALTVGRLSVRLEALERMQTPDSQVKLRVCR